MTDAEDTTTGLEEESKSEMEPVLDGKRSEEKETTKGNETGGMEEEKDPAPEERRSDGKETAKGNETRAMKEKKDSTTSELPSLNREEIKHKVLTEKAKMYIKPHRGCATSDYLISVREKNSVKHFPEWDSSQKSLTRSMIESKKKLSIAENLLRQKREEFVRNCQERDKQITELTGKELKLKESFEFFDEFVKENIEKRQRAVERKRMEREARDKIMQDIERVNRRIGRLRIIRQEMLESIEANAKYRDYLLDVGVKMPKEFR
ncbi:hypothetical protein LSTR_LSTR016291 [Laodelphax striatellus]|uniref:DUF4200 domain-containing protein n=1 Tax=Laodelphax striatellus TaxID=195883 RepID=A0A482WW90_LAOST|nr:hypothetical protein LSTR_LSTR016291 [Laodelphax striatellus]